MMMLKNSANGMLTPTMMALRRSPRKIHWITNTRMQPKMRLCSTVWVVTLDQRGAVIERHDLDARRQRPVAVDFFHLGVDARHHVVGVKRAVHHQDSGHDIVLVIAAGFAEPRHIADIDLRDILDLNRYAVRLGQRNVLDVVDFITLGQIQTAAAVDEADAADIDGLLTEIDGATADIDIGVADRGDHLRYGDVIGVELVEIDLDLDIPWWFLPRY